MVTEFTPWQAAFGGMLIGLASVMLMWTHGRIMGATGILSGILQPLSSSDWVWRVVLVAGMVSGPALVWAVSGTMPEVQVPMSLPMMVAGGVLVGIGVTYGSGCTSGHGVCGNARLSPRSMAATATFMLACGLTVYVMRHWMGI